jgi:hypothetical protein
VRPSRQRKGALKVSATCDSTAFDGSCNQYTRRYQCTNVTASTSTPTVVELNTSYTITSNTLDTSQCTSYRRQRQLRPCRNHMYRQHTLQDDQWPASLPDDGVPIAERGAKLGRFLLVAY